MEISVQAQGWAMVQALLLGAVAGVLYDLFRILRVRVPIPLLGSVLDLVFWVFVTAMLFVWSLEAWGGWIRLYGAAGLLLGGILYFWLLSPALLKLGYRIADGITFLIRLVLLPMRGVIFLLKKMKNFAKKRFPSVRKWYTISQITEEMATTDCRKAARQLGGASDESQKGRVTDQNRGVGTADLFGYNVAESEHGTSKRRE